MNKYKWFDIEYKLKYILYFVFLFQIAFFCYGVYMFPVTNVAYCNISILEADPNACMVVLFASIFLLYSLGELFYEIGRMFLNCIKEIYYNKSVERFFLP